VTALVAASLLRQPGVPQAQKLELTKRALDSLVQLQKPDGGIYERDLPDYITSVSVMALVAGGRPEDRRAIERARDFLVKQQLDEGEGVKPDDKFYGGMGYGGTTTRDGGRADMVSLEYGLRAMKEAGLPKDDAAWQKAIKFLQRAQNNSETNDQRWAGNDGGFLYYPGFSFSPLGELHSYGSVSYAGLLSYTYANLTKSDPQVQAVMKWIRDNYSVDENPGLGQKTVYYYYMVFAKALKAVGETFVTDAQGRRHNWREELGQKLISLQHAEGFWVNSVPDEMQDNKVVVTAFTMSAIEAILE
jgi:squalene-hopene/tetraprenyl-beta-curcumene cyclase